uniref:Hsp70 family chaperone n=1 Tax=Bionectria ochroleuca TaxID=29856 RepID=A0A0B7KIY5_BIOOC
MAAETPDVIVSIDLGTTFTGRSACPIIPTTFSLGVAWMTPQRPIQVINDWPGSGDRGERKVPTTLVYNADGTLSTWGFACADDDDPTPAGTQQQGLSSVPRSTAEARGFLTDYLKQVYSHIKESIETQLGRRQQAGGWEPMSVSFLFSVPTTWTKMGVINTFKSIVRDAGYGTEGPRHVAQVDLTEAEAASIATLKTSAIEFQPGNLFLTVDAGGGTTDLALMRVTSGDSVFPQMSQVAAVQGIGIGSSLIDRAFVRLVSQRLAACPEVQSSLPGDCPARMARSHHFKTVKHKFGEKVYMQQVFKIQMEGVSFDFSHPGAGIEAGRMLFTKEEIQSLFDAQIDGMMRRIREQLDWISEAGLQEQVEYLILAGGLGSSAYIREEIQRQLALQQHPNAGAVVIVPCQEPQLVVVRGLLLEQQQKIATGSPAGVLTSRIARASYGVVIKVPFSATYHDEEDASPDPYDPRQIWALRQIQWLIRKGDTVQPNSAFTKTFEIRLGSDETTRSWDSSFITSNLPVDKLPTALRQPGAEKLCAVKSDLTGVQQHELVLKQKRGTCFKKGYKYYICQFDVKVIVAPADLRFELWFGGTKFSGNHDPISVSWE